jgi:hypothetical protein
LSISYCVEKKGFFIGCSWRPKNRPRTVIVTNEEEMTGNDPMLWAHEFGHTTGLLHRNDKYNFVLMTPCPIEAFNTKINKNECRHFLTGPVQHYPPGLGPACPNVPFKGFRTD